MKKILLVDDNLAILDVLGMFFHMEGFSVKELDNGHTIYQEVSSFRPDIILLDVMLGNQDGRDICNSLKSIENTRDIPVILVSASHGVGSLYEKNCRADDFVAKPFDLNDLVETVRRHL